MPWPGVRVYARAHWGLVKVCSASRCPLAQVGKCADPGRSRVTVMVGLGQPAEARRTDWGMGGAGGAHPDLWCPEAQSLPSAGVTPAGVLRLHCGSAHWAQEPEKEGQAGREEIQGKEHGGEGVPKDREPPAVPPCEDRADGQIGQTFTE